MALFTVFLTVPLSIGFSLFLALSPTRNVFRQHKTFYLAVLGGLIFCLSIITIEILHAGDIYSHSVGKESRLQEAVISNVESNKVPILIEFALRDFFGKGRYDQTCHTQLDICLLADKMMDDAPTEFWNSGNGPIVSVVGVITALASTFSLLFFLFLNMPNDK